MRSFPISFNIISNDQNVGLVLILHVCLLFIEYMAVRAFIIMATVTCFQKT